MVQAIRPICHAPCYEVELRRVQIPGRRIHAQRVLISGGWDALRCANRSGVEQQLREERWAIAGTANTGTALKHFECRDFRGLRTGWQIEHGHALVMTERIRHVRPVEKMPPAPQGFDTVLS